MAEKEFNFYEPIETKYSPAGKGIEWASKVAEAVQRKYDAFLATQLALIAKERGVSVEELCLRHNVCVICQKIDGDIKFWVEIK